MSKGEPSLEQEGISVRIRGYGPVSRRQAVNIVDQIENSIAPITAGRASQTNANGPRPPLVLER